MITTLPSWYSRRSLSLTLPVLLTLWLNGCATYTPQPLDEQADLIQRPTTLIIDPRTLPLPALRAHPFDPTNGLDMTEVAMIAVINNPDLKAERRKADVARAQLFDAGLLPDPQISASLDHPMGSGPGLTDAYGVGLNYDLISLITHGAQVNAAALAKHQVELDLLWHEWQVAQQARELYVKAVYDADRLRLLIHAQQLYAQRYARSSRAFKNGNLTLDVAGTDLTALLDANTRLNQAQRQQNQTRHDLDALLGLTPDVQLNLVSPGEAGALDADPALLKTLPRRRPDLLALRAGYRSQEARVRQAVLSQFPSLNVGFTRARDTGDVNTIGLGVTLNLPLLNGNRGAIAIQRATRAQLRQEYQARLDQTHGQIDMLEKQNDLIEQQIRRIDANLPELTGMVDKAEHAYDAGNIDALTYLNMQNTLINKQLEKADLEESLWDTHIALDTLLGWTRWEN